MLRLNFSYLFSWEPWPRDILFLAKMGRRCTKLLHSWNLTMAVFERSYLFQAAMRLQIHKSKFKGSRFKSELPKFPWKMKKNNQPTWKLLEIAPSEKIGQSLRYFKGLPSTHWPSFWPFKMDSHFNPKTVPEHFWREKHHGMLKLGTLFGPRSYFPLSTCIFWTSSSHHFPTQPRTPVKGSFFPTGPIDITIEANSTKKPRCQELASWRPPRWVCLIYELEDFVLIFLWRFLIHYKNWW